MWVSAVRGISNIAIHNTEIADKLDELADLLDIENANPFRIRAYRNAARVIRGHPYALAELVTQEADLTKLPHVGAALAQKIHTIVETGELPALDAARRRTPVALSTLMKVRGLGPNRVRALYHGLRIRSLPDLERAARRGRIRALPGFGAKTEAMILVQIEKLDRTERRFNRLSAHEIAHPLVAYLRRIEGVKRVTVAGSYRRCAETVGDLDILATVSRGSPITERFVEYDEVVEVVSHGSTRSTIYLRSGIQVDLRVVPEVSHGAALHYFTGSKDHNIAVRTLAAKRGLKINEYGVFRKDVRIAGRTENEVFDAVGLLYIPPELRENRGEIEAAAEGRLPALIQQGDIRGDLHCHTKATDGHNSVREMARAAKKRGYEYLAITDHSSHVTIAHGLDGKRLAKHIDEIDRLNDELKGIVILKSCEVDILENGSLDLSNALLERLDLTVCAVHYQFHLSRKKQTERILKAMDNKYFNILAHPTGRLINERPPYDVDLERVMETAAEQGCFMEVNAHPHRLDLTDEACRMAKDLGVRVSIATDAHSVDGLDFMHFGVEQARRGWLGPDEVLNTRPWIALKSMLAR